MENDRLSKSLNWKEIRQLRTEKSKLLQKFLRKFCKSVTEKELRRLRTNKSKLLQKKRVIHRSCAEINQNCYKKKFRYAVCAQINQNCYKNKRAAEASVHK